MFGHLKLTVSKVLVLDFDHINFVEFLMATSLDGAYQWISCPLSLLNIFCVFNESKHFFCGQWFFRAIHQWQYLQNWSKFTPFFLAIFERRKLLSKLRYLFLEDWSKRTLKFDGKYTGEEVPRQVFREAEVLLVIFRKSWIILSCKRWKVGNGPCWEGRWVPVGFFFFKGPHLFLRAYSDGTCSGLCNYPRTPRNVALGFLEKVNRSRIYMFAFAECPCIKHAYISDEQKLHLISAQCISIPFGSC